VTTKKLYQPDEPISKHAYIVHSKENRPVATMNP
jgi:hypothetical protein